MSLKLESHIFSHQNFSTLQNDLIMTWLAGSICHNIGGFKFEIKLWGDHNIPQYIVEMLFVYPI